MLLFHNFFLQGLYSLTGRAILERETAIELGNQISIGDTLFQTLLSVWKVEPADGFEPST